MNENLLKKLQDEPQEILSIKYMELASNRELLYKASTIHLNRLIQCLNKQSNNSACLKEYVAEIESWLKQKDWWLARDNIIKELNNDNTKPLLPSAEEILFYIGNKFSNEKVHISKHTEIIRLCFFALENNHSKEEYLESTLLKVIALWPQTIDHKSIQNSQIAKKKRGTTSPLNQYIEELLKKNPNMKAKDIFNRLKNECDNKESDSIIEEYNDDELVWYQNDERKTAQYNTIKSTVSRINKKIKK
ncbi:hypothetical protein CXF72_03265 [Psychromonas sp. MB-3u-54]|uniref:hypothetical protein n=1 Tax=Psychromonas sp. MB-3u-54 TaxID=2058319 RepID=UPI000C334758|nr:hypothetical protein [Psychromonas sp. MB-3u-54]PKH04013.1 hypothetical protein CXF72_03265 [Psychromonas sp. MB-3u-54]